MTLNDFVKTAINSDRLLVMDSNGKELYRGFIGCLQYKDIDGEREVKQCGISAEIYTTKTMKGEVGHMGNKLVYICSPYRGEVERNLQYARELTRIALDNDFVPITPHLYLTQAVNDEVPEERKKGMAAGKELLKHCKYILIGSKYGLSAGMLEEIEIAIQCGTIELAPTKAGLIEIYNGGQKP